MKITDILTYKAPLNRHGLFSKWVVQVGDHSSVAPTREGAEEEAVRAIKAALTDSYTPILIFSIDRIKYALCWRETNGWWYCVGAVGVSPSKVGWTGMYDSAKECEQAARVHLRDWIGAEANEVSTEGVEV